MIVANIICIVIWLICGILNLKSPTISKYSYGLLLGAFIFELIMDTIELFIMR